MTTNARLNKAADFISRFSPSYRRETDPKVLKARKIIISWATPDFKIHRSRFPEIMLELEAAECASSVGIIKFTLSLYKLTWGVLRGDEKAKARMQHLVSIKQSWYTKPLKQLLDDGITWEIIQETYVKEKIEKTIADSLSEKQPLPSDQPTMELPAPFQKIDPSLVGSIHTCLVRFTAEAKRLQSEKCDDCPVRKNLANCMDDRTTCQSELKLKDALVDDLRKRLKEKELELCTIKESLRILANGKQE